MRDERRLQPGRLPVGEAFASGTQEAAGAVERVALASPVSQRVLLDTTADIIDCAGGKLDDVEDIQHAGGAFQLVIARVLIPLERVQRRDSHPVPEGGAPRVEPVLVHGARASRDEVQQAGYGVSAAGEVDHAGQFFRPPPARTRVVPDVLVGAQDFDAGASTHRRVSAQGILTSLFDPSNQKTRGSGTAGLRDRNVWRFRFPPEPPHGVLLPFNPRSVVVDERVPGSLQHLVVDADTRHR